MSDGLQTLSFHRLSHSIYIKRILLNSFSFLIRPKFRTSPLKLLSLSNTQKSFKHSRPYWLYVWIGKNSYLHKVLCFPYFYVITQSCTHMDPSCLSGFYELAHKPSYPVLPPWIGCTPEQVYAMYWKTKHLSFLVVFASWKSGILHSNNLAMWIIWLTLFNSNYKSRSYIKLFFFFSYLLPCFLDWNTLLRWSGSNPPACFLYQL